MVYQYKKGTCLKVSAQAAGEMCAQLEATVGLTPKTLLDANRDPRAALHNEFEWDDSIAAENYRESQASYIIRHIEIVPDVSAENEPVRAFVSVQRDRREYASLDVVVRDEELQKQLFEQALRDMNSFRIKYSRLDKVRKVITEMDNLIAMKEAQ